MTAIIQGGSLFTDASTGREYWPCHLFILCKGTEGPNDYGPKRPTPSWSVF